MPEHQPPQQDARAKMTSEMQLFSQQIGDRIVAINAMQVDGDPWFRANDVAFALGYKNAQDAVRRHVSE